MIFRWFVHTTAFKVVVGFVLAMLILFIISQITRIIFRVIKRDSIRIVACIGASIISAYNCFQYSKWSCLPILVVVVLSIIGCTEEKRILQKADGIKFTTSPKFSENTLDRWSYLLTYAFLEPVLSCVNVIVCRYYDVDILEWFRFCWTFEMGVFQNEIIRYTVALMPWLLLLIAYIPISEIKEKEWLIDIEDVQQREDMAEEAEKRRILRMNPDAGIVEDNFTLEEDAHGDEENCMLATEEDRETDDILSDISKFL